MRALKFYKTKILNKLFNSRRFEKVLFGSVAEKSTATKNTKFSEAGVVISVVDGIAKVKGLLSVGFGELVEFSSSDVGIVLSIESNFVQVVLFGNDRNILPGDAVTRKNSSLEIYVSFNFLGRIVDSLGNFIDGKEKKDIKESTTYEKLQKEDISETALNAIVSKWQQFTNSEVLGTAPKNFNEGA